MVRVYGVSDDLVEIEGTKYPDDEIDCFDKDVMIGFKDGTEIRVGYPKENMAVWGIEIEETGGAAYAMNGCDDQDAEIYSDVFSIDSEVAWHKVVRKGEKKA